jgi:autotransporter passenger strand-loop-strand repeat protein
LVTASGLETVGAGAEDADAEIGSGGEQLVFGQALETTILSGGTAIVSGGSEAAAIVSSGGLDMVSSGGVALLTTVLSGGLLTLTTGSDAAFTDLSQGGALDLADLAYAPGGTARVTYGDELVVSTSSGSYSQTLTGDYDKGSFAVAADGAGGTLVTFEALPCFRAGTRILTGRGEVPVEKLAVGDGVVTVSGEVLPIVWLGAREVDCRRHPHPTKVWPVRIAANAFGPGRPARSLDLSPDHAVFAAGVLIPVKHLINGASIRQLQARRVRYLHLELPTHAVILAEGLPTESYLDTGDRQSFTGDVVSLHPAWGSVAQDVTLVLDALGAAPLRVSGPEVEAVRASLAERVGSVANFVAVGRDGLRAGEAGHVGRQGASLRG